VDRYTKRENVEWAGTNSRGHKGLATLPPKPVNAIFERKYSPLPSQTNISDSLRMTFAVVTRTAWELSSRLFGQSAGVQSEGDLPHALSFSRLISLDRLVVEAKTDAEGHFGLSGKG
jgi:hypothetical protein